MPCWTTIRGRGPGNSSSSAGSHQPPNCTVSKSELFLVAFVSFQIFPPNTQPPKKTPHGCCQAGKHANIAKENWSKRCASSGPNGLKLQNRENFTGKISTKSSHANMVQDLNNQKRSTPQHGGKHQRTNPMLTYLFNTMSPLRKVKLWNFQCHFLDFKNWQLMPFLRPLWHIICLERWYLSVDWRWEENDHRSTSTSSTRKRNITNDPISTQNAPGIIHTLEVPVTLQWNTCLFAIPDPTLLRLLKLLLKRHLDE